MKNKNSSKPSRVKLLFLTFLILLIPCFAMATVAAPSYTKGKEYKAVTVSPSAKAAIQVPKGKVSVVEFFSYGCPWCFHLEPSLEKWLKTKPGYVEFSRVPVVFEAGWKMYAKAYYTAEALGILHKITPAIFNAIHVKNESLTSESAMQKFFEKQGVSKTKFDNAFNFSPGMDMELERGQNLMIAYRIFAVPTLLINGKYYINAELIKGDDQEMIKVLNYLVKKEKPAATKAGAK